MLRILKSNPMLSLILPILVTMAIWICGNIISAGTIEKSDIPLFQVFFGWLCKMPFLAALSGLCLLMLEAHIWNAFINRETLLRQSSYFPAMIYLFLLSCRHLLLGFYPALIASMFLILAFKRLAESYKKDKAISEAFDAGVFIGLASLVYFPVTVFIVFLWIGLLTMRSLIWREWAVSLIGFVLPFGFALTYYSVFYSPEYFWDKLIVAIQNYNKVMKPGWHQVLLIITLGATILVSIIFFLKKFPDNVVKNQKILALMIWFACFSAASIVLAPQKNACAFSLLAIPFSFIFSNYFVRAKSKLVPELMFMFLVIAIIVNIFY
jgi:hypothetical protein